MSSCEDSMDEDSIPPPEYEAIQNNVNNDMDDDADESEEFWDESYKLKAIEESNKIQTTNNSHQQAVSSSFPSNVTNEPSTNNIPSPMEDDSDEISYDEADEIYDEEEGHSEIIHITGDSTGELSKFVKRTSSIKSFTLPPPPAVVNNSSSNFPKTSTTNSNTKDMVYVIENGKVTVPLTTKEVIESNQLSSLKQSIALSSAKQERPRSSTPSGSKGTREFLALQKSFTESKVLSEFVNETERSRKTRKLPLKWEDSNVGPESEKFRICRSRSKSCTKTSMRQSTSLNSTGPRRWPSDEKLNNKRENMRSQNTEFVQKQMKFLSRVNHQQAGDEPMSEVSDGEQSLNESSKTAGSLEAKDDCWQPPPKRGADSYCWKCRKCADLIACSKCPRSFHAKCIKISSNLSLIDKCWICPECVNLENCINGSKKSKKQNLPTDLLNQLLLFALKRMKEVKGHERLLDVPDPIECPAYQMYVVNPVTLNSIQEKIERKEFRCTDEFVLETKWIQHNVSTAYSAFTNKDILVAKTLLKVCRQEATEIETCSECYLNANTRKDWFLDVCMKPHILLWAKLKGFPYWPAKGMGLGPNSLLNVRFFGDHDRAFVPVKDCYLYSAIDPNPYTGKRSFRPGIADCIKEIDVHIQKIRAVVGGFNYAQPKTLYDPNNEMKQLEDMMPGVMEYIKRQQAIQKPPLTLKIVKTAGNNLSIIMKTDSGTDSDQSNQGLDKNRKFFRKSFDRNQGDSKLNDVFMTTPSKPSSPSKLTTTSKLATSTPKTYANKANYEVVAKPQNKDEISSSKINSVILKRKSEVVGVTPKIKKSKSSEEESMTELPANNSSMSLSPVKHEEARAAECKDEVDEKSVKRKRSSSPSGNIYSISPGSVFIGVPREPETKFHKENSELSSETTQENNPQQPQFQQQAQHPQPPQPSQPPLPQQPSQQPQPPQPPQPPQLPQQPQYSQPQPPQQQHQPQHLQQPQQPQPPQQPQHLQQSQQNQQSQQFQQPQQSQQTQQQHSQNQDQEQQLPQKIEQQPQKQDQQQQQKQQQHLPKQQKQQHQKQYQPQHRPQQTQQLQKPEGAPQRNKETSDTSSDSMSKFVKNRQGVTIKKIVSKNQSGITTYFVSEERSSNQPFDDKKQSTATKLPPQQKIVVPPPTKPTPTPSPPKPIQSCSSSVPTTKPHTPIPSKENVLERFVPPKGLIPFEDIKVENYDDELITSTCKPMPGKPLEAVPPLISKSTSPALTLSSSSSTPPGIGKTSQVGTDPLLITLDPDSVKNEVLSEDDSSIHSVPIEPSPNQSLVTVVVNQQPPTTTTNNNIQKSEPPRLVGETMIKRIVVRSLESLTMAPPLVKIAPASNCSSTINPATPPLTVNTSVASSMGQSRKQQTARARKSFPNKGPNQSTVMLPPDVRRSLTKNSMVYIPGDNQKNSIPIKTAVSKTFCQPMVKVTCAGTVIPTSNTNQNHSVNSVNPAITTTTSCTLSLPSSIAIPLPAPILAMSPITVSATTVSTSLTTTSTVVTSSTCYPTNYNATLNTRTTPETTTQNEEIDKIDREAEGHILSGIVTSNLAAAITDTIVCGPPRLSHKPNGALRSDGNYGFNSDAGPVCRTLVQSAHKITDFFISVIQDTVSDMANADVLPAKIAELQMELETKTAEYEKRLYELKQNTDTMLCEMKKSMETERLRIIAETRKQCEIERIHAVEQTKKRQWCANCGREANSYCCWNTSYCDANCQSIDWNRHKPNCCQVNPHLNTDTQGPGVLYSSPTVLSIGSTITTPSIQTTPGFMPIQPIHLYQTSSPISTAVVAQTSNATTNAKKTSGSPHNASTTSSSATIEMAYKSKEVLKLPPSTFLRAIQPNIRMSSPPVHRFNIPLPINTAATTGGPPYTLVHREGNWELLGTQSTSNVVAPQTFQHQSQRLVTTVTANLTPDNRALNSITVRQNQM